MVVYDESGHRIEEYDLDKGYLETKSEAVEHRWVVDSEERGEWVTLKEYPETGGKDVEWSVTAEEQGHWKTTNAEGEEVADFDGTLSDDWPHDVPVPDVFEYAIYHPYTEEELEECEKQRQEAEYASRQAMQLQAYNLMAARAQVATLEFESETEIAEVSTLLPDWVPDGHEYKQGDAFQWEKRTWRASQNTTNSPCASCNPRSRENAVPRLPSLLNILICASRSGNPLNARFSSAAELSVEPSSTNRYSMLSRRVWRISDPAHFPMNFSTLKNGTITDIFILSCII